MKKLLLISSISLIFSGSLIGMHMQLIDTHEPSFFSGEEAEVKAIIDRGDLNSLSTQLNLGFQVNAFLDQYHTTPLMKAAEKGNLNMIRLLKKKGAKRNLKNRSGHTAREIAVLNGHKDIVKELTPFYKLLWKKISG